MIRIAYISGLSLCAASVKALVAEAGILAAPIVESIAEWCSRSKRAGADETGGKVAGVLHGLHVFATENLTHIAPHEKRGMEAFASIGILGRFEGVLTHDGWKPYRALACEHSLCNAHHARELAFVHEELGQEWAGAVRDLLMEACSKSNEAQAHGKPLAHKVRQEFREAYDDLLTIGREENPLEKPRGKKGGTKPSKASNLIGRLVDFADEVWRFAKDPSVPFTNNEAERVMRMIKVKQKVSGGFRTQEGLEAFCTLRSFFDTMRKQGRVGFESLLDLFEGRELPPLSA